MALDEPTDDDERRQEDGMLIVAARDMLERFGGVKIEYRSQPFGGGGFLVSPGLKPETSCGDCCC